MISMAVNIEQLKNPKVLVIVGVAVVGGIFVASKINGKKKQSDVPTEVPVSYQVDSVDSVQKQDELSRSLTDAQSKYDELTRKQQEQQEAYQQQLDTLNSGRQSERDSFNSRLLAEQQRLGTQYSNQLASLQATIDRLTAAQNKPVAGDGNLNSPINVTQTPNTPHAGSTVPAAPASGVVVAGKRYYPGFGYYNGAYPMNCDGKPRVLLFSTFDAAVQDQKTKGLSSTSLARNMVGIAVTGSTKRDVLYGDKLENWYWQNWVNTTRVDWGLAPLNQEQMNALRSAMYAGWNGNETDARFQSLAYARALWQQFNLPYQCGVSQRRFN